MYKYLLFMASAVGSSGRFASSDPVEVCSGDVCHADIILIQSPILPIEPSPLAYAYLSEASYINAEQDSDDSWFLKGEEDDQHVIGKLDSLNWELADFVERKESGYVGSIWVNHHEKQVVLAHRGSAELTTYNGLRSWATDARSIVRDKPSDFVNHAIEMLNNPTFLARRAEGFHPSITGHSLGGFLAQACVAHSYRRGGEFDATYHPGMSAVVFDSPGAADFIDDYIRSNLEAEKARLPNDFNIMNFCISPTIVSAFGRPYGVIYQFITGKSREWASVGWDHKLEERIRPYLEQAEEDGEHWTSSCLRVEQWPRIELPKNIDALVSAGVEGVTKGVFWLMNSMWQKAKYLATGDESVSILDSALGSSGSSVAKYFSASADAEKTREYERAIKKAMTEKHRLFDDRYTRLHMGVEHLDVQVLEFMRSMMLAKRMIARNNEYDFGWNNHLETVYGKEFDLGSLSIEKSGEREELVLNDDSYFNNVFNAAVFLQSSLREKGIEIFEGHILKVVHSASSESEDLQRQIDAIVEEVKATKPNVYAAYKAEAKQSALVMFGEKDREFAREIFSKVKPGDTFEAFVAVAETGNAAVVPEGMSESDKKWADSFFEKGASALAADVSTKGDSSTEGRPGEDTLGKPQAP